MSFTPEVMRLKQRRGTQAQWEAVSALLLLEGEIGWDTTNQKFKVGDGTSAWSALDYWEGSGLQGPQGPQGWPGNQGAQGAQGAPGDAGAQGVQGGGPPGGGVDGGGP